MLCCVEVGRGSVEMGVRVGRIKERRAGGEGGLNLTWLFMNLTSLF
jgi:hypothetical protein